MYVRACVFMYVYQDGLIDGDELLAQYCVAHQRLHVVWSYVSICMYISVWLYVRIYVCI